MQPTELELDIDEVPFSVRGAWIDLSRIVGLHRRADEVHLVTHQTGMHPIFALVPHAGGEAVNTRTVAKPHILSWIAEEGTVEAVFDGTRAIRVRGSGLGMRFEASSELTPFSGGYLFRDPLDGSIVLTSYESGRRYRLTVLDGDVSVAGAGVVGAAERAVSLDGAAPWEVAVEELGTAAVPYDAGTPFDELVSRRETEFRDYARAIAGDADGDVRADAAALKAAYVLWSATVSPSGFVGREAILMSKHWMDKVWSWDHCFNALALAEADPDAALAQFLLPFDHQDASGALPDSVTHSEVLYNFVKPPIHGWAFARLRARSSRTFSTAELREVYERMAAWTRFWLDFRRAPGQPLPYYQHGNDSGWDNATMFDTSRVVVAPDLAAFLLLQLRELRDLADLLGESGQQWDTEAAALEAALFARLWAGDHFTAVDATTGQPAPATSLLNSLPIVLGERLPDDVASALAATIAEHLTEWGPATEPVDSPLYESDGYWRGPIWAPSTVLIEDGLRRAGHHDLADRVSASFRAACERSGFAENFDAVTGEGLRDRAYTWTASSYLILSIDAARRSRADSSGER
ncbi:amylo-alpha-1,6-glucosidase [Leifsonia sp. 2MCAF36]|uniref:amylo-alpha-1,6-glucosidase n=1 Tax=Leifsonia sp. 2MCAF36 TaxID=3232988 RepID=UPI003F9B4A0A